MIGLDVNCELIDLVYAERATNYSHSLHSIFFSYGFFSSVDAQS